MFFLYGIKNVFFFYFYLGSDAVFIHAAGYAAHHGSNTELQSQQRSARYFDVCCKMVAPALNYLGEVIAHLPRCFPSSVYELS